MKFATRGRDRVRLITGAATALLLTLGGALGASTAASAAPDVTYPDAISNLTIERQDGGSGTLNQWEFATITGDWQVPNTAVGGETFGMTLPSEFTRFGTGTFALEDPNGVAMAQCVVSQDDAPEIVCTLDDVVNDLDEVKGSFWMSVQVKGTTTSDTVTFDLGSTFAVVDLPGTGGITPENMTAATAPYKYADASDEDGVIKWTIGFPGSAVSNGAVTITDELDRALENHHYEGTVYLASRPVENGQLVGDWTRVDSTRYSVEFADDLKTFTFTGLSLDSGDVSYRLQYTTFADGIVLDGDVFGNKATVGTQSTDSTFTVRAGGGGTGSGIQYTRFTVTKELTGAQAALVEDSSFTVRYSVKDSTDAAKTMTVPVGEPVRSDRAPLGSTFIIEEIDLPEIDDVEWGQWTLTGDGVSEGENGTYEVTPDADGVALTLTNVANAVTPVLGSLSWTKVDPDGAALAGSEWTLTGPGGDVTVIDNGDNDADPADGALEVTDLALGEYTLTETKAPTGYTATDETFTATITEETVDAAFGAIVNTPVVVPPTPVTPVTPVTPEKPVTPENPLLATGGTPALALGGAAVLLVGAGLSALLLRRRRPEAEQIEA